MALDVGAVQTGGLDIGAVETVLTDIELSPGAGSITYTPGTPAVDFGFITPAPPAGAIAYTGGAPTVSFSGTISLAPGAATITYTAGTPTVELGIPITPGAGVLTYTAGAPTVALSGTISLAPGAATITYTGGTPTVTAALTIIPGAGSIVYTPGTPTLSKTIFIAPATGQIRYSAGTPFVSFVRTTASGTKLYVGDVEYGKWKTTTFKKDASLNGSVSASFSLEYTGGSKPARNQEVALFVEGIKRFGGLVNSVMEESRPANPTQSILNVSCVGFQALLERVIVAKLFTLFLGGTAAITVYNLWQQYLAQFGVTYPTDEGPGTVLGEQLFHYITLKEAYNRIQAQTPGYNIWIDDNKRLHYGQTTLGATPNAPFSLDRTLPNCDSFELTKTNKRFANRVYVLPSGDIKALWIDTATGDGSSLPFVTTYVLNSAPIVRVNGAPKLVTSLGNWISGWEVYYIPGGIGVFFASPPALGARIEILYPSPFPLALMAEDAVSIAAVGLQEYVYQAKDIPDAITAQEFADALLALLVADDGDQIINFRYNSVQQDEWLTPGMVIGAKWTFPDVINNFAVESVSSEEQAFRLWRHTVSLRFGPADMSEAQILEFYRRRVPINSPPQRVTLEMDIEGVGVQVGTLVNRYEFQEDGVFTFWSALPGAQPPVGADIVVDAFLNGVSIFPTESPVTNAKKVRFLDGQTTANSGIEFVSENLAFSKGDVLTWEVLQVGSTTPGTYGVVYLGMKQRSTSH